MRVERGAARLDGHGVVVPKRFAMPDARGRVRRRRLARVLRAAVDAGLAAVFVALMATATVEEFAHEWLGISAFVLFVAHQMLNRHWWASVFKGRYTAMRIAATVVNLGLVLCIVGQMASSLVLSEHAFGWLPAFDGAWWARVVHLLCSYWGFALAAVHAGLHLAAPVRALYRRSVALFRVACVAAAAMACFGIWSFARLDMATYLFMQSQFVFVDPTVPLAITAIEYASIGVLLAVASYGALALRKSVEARKGKAGTESVGGTSVDSRRASAQVQCTRYEKGSRCE